MIFIFRLSDEGEPQLLNATGSGPSDGRYTFTANSPDGFSIFGLLALPPVDRPAIPILSLEPPGSITVEVDTLGGAMLENTAIQRFLASATTGQGSAAEVNILPDPLPTVFPEGNTLVTFVATDALGNLVTDSATITVASTGPPTLQVPRRLVIGSREPLPASDPRLQEFLGKARATAVVAGELAVTNDSPNVFPFGDTVVTFTATDSSGNQAIATAIVTVNQLAPDLQVTGVRVTPGRAFSDRPVTVAVQVENLGTASGTRRLKIRLDDRVIESVEVTLMPGESQTVEREIGTAGPEHPRARGSRGGKEFRSGASSHTGCSGPSDRSAPDCCAPADLSSHTGCGGRSDLDCRARADHASRTGGGGRSDPHCRAPAGPNSSCCRRWWTVRGCIGGYSRGCSVGPGSLRRWVCSAAPPPGKPLYRGGAGGLRPSDVLGLLEYRQRGYVK